MMSVFFSQLFNLFFLPELNDPITVFLECRNYQMKPLVVGESHSNFMPHYKVTHSHTMWGYLTIIKNILLPWCVFKAWPTFDGQQFIDLFNDTKAQSKSIISLEAALKRWYCGIRRMSKPTRSVTRTHPHNLMRTLIWSYYLHVRGEKY